MKPKTTINQCAGKMLVIIDALVDLWKAQNVREYDDICCVAAFSLSSTDAFDSERSRQP